MIKTKTHNQLIFSLKKQIKNAYLNKDLTSLNSISETLLDLFHYYDSLKDTTYNAKEKQSLIDLYTTTLYFEGQINKNP
ncbi:MAG: hypothetical protein ACXACO_19735 [Promethearchaeota archaeon]|jgi:hypothetical protein